MAVAGMGMAVIGEAGVGVVDVGVAGVGVAASREVGVAGGGMGVAAQNRRTCSRHLKHRSSYIRDNRDVILVECPETKGVFRREEGRERGGE